LKPVQIIVAAELELREATGWYLQRAPRVADRFTAETRRTLQLIETFPQIGGRVPSIDDPDVRQLPVHAFPYHIVFLNLPDRIEVIAFAHHRRRPAYFAARLRRS
jgi:toxin ParE1/3/4